MTGDRLAALLKYIAAHAGGIGAICAALVLFLNGKWAEGVAALSAALAAWGQNTPPAQQIELKAITKESQPS